MIPKNTICLWYDGTAEEAANFYAKTFPDSAVQRVYRAPSDYPSGKKGDVLTVDFTVAGIACMGLNGGPAFRHSEAFSFQIATDDQQETDRLWNAIVGNGGQESECGWCKDRRPRSRRRPAHVRGDDDHAQDRYCRHRGCAPGLAQASGLDAVVVAVDRGKAQAFI
jgi:predicted 3-demethylubiquinone-9 3-methyltransferase (glyoxalase superfamily)